MLPADRCGGGELDLQHERPRPIWLLYGRTPSANRLTNPQETLIKDLARCAVVHADDHRSIGDDDRIPALLRGNLQPALDCGDGHDAVRQFFCHRGSVDRAWIRHADGHIDKHVAGSLAERPEETKARVTYGIRDGALGRLGRVAAVNINAHAHLGDAAHACHRTKPPSFGVEPYLR